MNEKKSFESNSLKRDLNGNFIIEENLKFFQKKASNYIESYSRRHEIRKRQDEEGPYLRYKTKKDLIDEVISKFYCSEQAARIRTKGQLLNYLRTTAENHIKDEIAIEIKKDSPGGSISISEFAFLEDRKAEVPGSKDFFISGEDYIPGEILESAKRSLGYISALYEHKEKMKADSSHIPGILNLLLKTEEEIKAILGRSINKKISRYKELSNKKLDLSEDEKEDLKTIEKSKPEWEFLIDIENLIKKAVSIPRSWQREIVFDALRPGDLVSVMPLTAKEIFITIPHLRIQPPRVIYEIWKKSDYFNGYGCLERMKKALSFFKNKSKKTKWEFLFKGIAEDADNLKTSIRKIKYDSIKNGRQFIKKFINFVYKKSFIEKIDIQDHPRSPDFLITMGLYRRSNFKG